MNGRVVSDIRKLKLATLQNVYCCTKLERDGMPFQGTPMSLHSTPGRDKPHLWRGFLRPRCAHFLDPRLLRVHVLYHRLLYNYSYREVCDSTYGYVVLSGTILTGRSTSTASNTECE